MVSFYRIKGEILCSKNLVELSIDAYFRKIEFIATILSSIWSPISNDDVFNIALGRAQASYVDSTSSPIMVFWLTSVPILGVLLPLWTRPAALSAEPLGFNGLAGPTVLSDGLKFGSAGSVGAIRSDRTLRTSSLVRYFSTVIALEIFTMLRSPPQFLMLMLLDSICGTSDLDIQELDKHARFPFVSSTTLVNSCLFMVISRLLRLSFNVFLLISLGLDLARVISIISSLHQEFSMTDMGPLNYFLGISVTHDSSGMFLSQCKFSLALTFTRPDISYALQQVCLPMHDPREPYFSTLKWVLRVRHVREFRHFAKECQKPKRVKDSAYHKDKMFLCKQAEQGIGSTLQLHGKDLGGSYSDSGTDSEPVEQVQNDAGYNVFANGLQHFKQSEYVSNTCLVETDDSNVIPNSPNMCEDDIQNEQNDVESDDECVAIANLKLDDTGLRFGIAFCVLRFGSAFCLIEDLIAYARSRPNGKMIVDSIENGPYIRRMIATPGEPDLPVPDEVNELRAERLAKTHDPLALMAHSQNSFNFPTTHKDQSSSSTHSQQSFPINNKYNPQPSLNQNFMQPPMTSLEDINDPTKAMNTALILFAKAFQLAAPTNNNQRTSSNPHNHHIAQPYAAQVAQNQQVYNAWQNGGSQGAQNTLQNAGVQSGGNQNGLVVVPRIANQNETGNVVTVRAEGTRIRNQARCYNCKGLGHIVRNCTARPKRRDDDYLQTQLPIAQKEEAGIQLQVEEFDFIAAAGDLDKIEEVNANCILMTNFVARKFLNVVKISLVTLQRVVKQKTTLEVHNWSSSAHKEVYIIISHEIAPIINQVDARVQNFEIQFLQEAVEFVRDFKSLSKEADESLDKQKSLELEIERLLKTSEKEYVVLWNYWYTKCEECKYDKILYDKAYNDMQQKVERLQAQLKDLKGKSSDTLSASNTLDPLNQMLEPKIVELEFQVLIAWVFENTSESMKTTSGTSVTSHVDKPKLSVVTPHSKKLHASIPSHSVPQPREFNVVKHRNVIAPEMFKINPSQTFRVDLVPNKQSRLVHTARTKRPQPKGNTRNARVLSASKSSEVKKNVTVEDHRRTLLLSKNKKTMSSECNNIKLAIQNDKSKIVCDTWSKDSLACKPRLPRLSLKWSPFGRSFDLKGKLVAFKETNYPNDDNACTSNPQEPMRKWFPNSTVFLGKLSKFVCAALTRVVPSI
nr:ribonuclease H-like domain-containing protein [Tanacetum cinerariifolium]